jgi:hypothetical protein
MKKKPNFERFVVRSTDDNLLILDHLKTSDGVSVANHRHLNKEKHFETKSTFKIQEKKFKKLKTDKQINIFFPIVKILQKTKTGTDREKLLIKNSYIYIIGISR